MVELLPKRDVVDPYRVAGYEWSSASGGVLHGCFYLLTWLGLSPSTPVRSHRSLWGKANSACTICGHMLPQDSNGCTLLQFVGMYVMNLLRCTVHVMQAAPSR